MDSVDVNIPCPIPQVDSGDTGVWTCVLCTAAELPGEGAAVFEAGGRRIAVFAVDGAHHAIDDYCSHGQSSLAEDGDLEGVIIICGLHKAQFDVRTGQVQRGPTRVSLRSYAIDKLNGFVHATERPLVEKKRRDSVVGR